MNFLYILYPFRSISNIDACSFVPWIFFALTQQPAGPIPESEMSAKQLGEMYTRKIHNWLPVMATAIPGIASLLFILIGIFGYLSFPDSEESNVLNNYPSTNIPIRIARVLIGVNVMFTFRLEMHPTRSIILDIGTAVYKQYQLAK